jgi:hypothetical protein
MTFCSASSSMPQSLSLSPTGSLFGSASFYAPTNFFHVGAIGAFFCACYSKLPLFGIGPSNYWLGIFQLYCCCPVLLKSLEN